MITATCSTQVAHQAAGGGLWVRACASAWVHQWTGRQAGRRAGGQETRQASPARPRPPGTACPPPSLPQPPSHTTHPGKRERAPRHVSRVARDGQALPPHQHAELPPPASGIAGRALPTPAPAAGGLSCRPAAPRRRSFRLAAPWRHHSLLLGPLGVHIDVQQHMSHRALVGGSCRAAGIGSCRAAGGINVRPGRRGCCCCCCCLRACCLLDSGLLLATAAGAQPGQAAGQLRLGAACDGGASWGCVSGGGQKGSGGRGKRCAWVGTRAPGAALELRMAWRGAGRHRVDHSQPSWKGGPQLPGMLPPALRPVRTCARRARLLLRVGRG